MLTDAAAAAADAVADDADDEPDRRVDQASGELTPEDILDYAGETDLQQVRELVLRSHGISEVGATFAPLTSLEVLSLSNNLVRSLAACAGMSRLTTLNINFNRVSSLEVRHRGARTPDWQDGRVVRHAVGADGRTGVTPV